MIGHGGKEFYLSGLAALSTLVTSAWLLLGLLGTIGVKGLARLHRFTAWFFDVGQHPVQAIGVVSGALVMIASLIWWVAQALI